ncbi:hypothetical protein [Lactococcus garvieae]|uniref:hypothetical protein n=1 Tax=Lactococcus garvieae TaxID=1363 RepID=UPI00385276C0
MDLSHATSENLIFLDCSFTTKEEIFDFVAKQFEKENKVSSAQEFKKHFLSVKVSVLLDLKMAWLFHMEKVQQ